MSRIFRTFQPPIILVGCELSVHWHGEPVHTQTDVPICKPHDSAFRLVFLFHVQIFSGSPLFTGQTFFGGCQHKRRASRHCPKSAQGKDEQNGRTCFRELRHTQRRIKRRGVDRNLKRGFHHGRRIAFMPNT